MGIECKWMWRRHGHGRIHNETSKMTNTLVYTHHISKDRACFDWQRFIPNVLHQFSQRSRTEWAFSTFQLSTTIFNWPFLWIISVWKLIVDDMASRMSYKLSTIDLKILNRKLFFVWKITPDGTGTYTHAHWTLIELIDLVLHVIKRFANAFDMPHTHNTHFNWWNRKWKIMGIKAARGRVGRQRRRGRQLNCVHSELFGCRSHTVMCHL